MCFTGFFSSLEDGGGPGSTGGDGRRHDRLHIWEKQNLYTLKKHTEIIKF